MGAGIGFGFELASQLLGPNPGLNLRALAAATVGGAVAGGVTALGPAGLLVAPLVSINTGAAVAFYKCEEYGIESIAFDAVAPLVGFGLGRAVGRAAGRTASNQLGYLQRGVRDLFARPPGTILDSGRSVTEVAGSYLDAGAALGSQISTIGAVSGLFGTRAFGSIR